MSKFIIEIRTKGFTQAKKGFEDIKKSSDKATDAKNRQRQATAGLRRQVGALRNNLLLVSFATVGLTKAIGGFVNASRKFEDVKTRLVGLTGSIQNAEVAFKAFNEVAATTPFMLDDVVNAGAQLQAFGLDAETTLRSVTDLAAFMGTTATEAANALGRAFAGGAGAADILRERGILNIIKTTQGLDDLSKTTLPQFRQALLKTLVDPASGIEGSSKRMTKTMTVAISNMQHAITRFQATVGDILAPTLLKAVQATEAFFRAIDIQSLADFGRHVTALGIALTAYNAKALVAMIRTANFSKVLRASVIGLIAVAIDQLLKYTGAFNSSTSAINANTQATQNATMNMQQYINSIGQSNMVLEKNIELQKAMDELTRGVALLSAENMGMDEQRLEMTKKMLNAETLLKQVLGDRVTVDTAAIFTQTAFNAEIDKGTDAELAFLNMVERGLVEQSKKIEKDKEMAMSSTDAANAIGLISGSMARMGKESMTVEQQLGLFLKTMARIIALTPGGQGFGAGLSAVSQFLAHSGGLIKNNGIQRFATGGMVQGQDNVPIMAQAGEFVMQRSAVSNIGLQNLAQMNQTGQPSGGLTINIAGDMVGDEDHVRTKVLPAIKEELRREANA